MSYILCDANGFLADGPSIQGLEDFAAWAQGEAARFVADGHSTDLTGLRGALGAPAEGTVDSTRAAILHACELAEGILILSDGMGADEPRTARTYHRETPVHAAADAHRAKIAVAVKYAFAVARKKLRTAGDNPGHPFHGNQWTDKGTEVVYHGTTDAIIDQILKDGVLPENKFKQNSFSPPDVIAYATANYTQAETYAVVRARKENAVPVIFEIHVPSDVITPGDRDGAVVALEHGFKPDWIKAVHRPNDKGKMERRELSAADVHVVYAVVLVQENIKTAGDIEGHTFHGNQYTGAGAIDTLGKDGFVSLNHFLIQTTTNTAPRVDAAIEQGGGHRFSLDLTQPLKTEQELVGADKTRKMVADWDQARAEEEPVRLAKNKETGELTVTDGNHRIVAALLRGEKSIKAVRVTLPAGRFRTAGDARADLVVESLQAALQDVLPPVLLQTLIAGGKAGLGMLKGMKLLGDNPGHEFHGNQWTADDHAWFKDSKVIDKDGNPLVVFHGSVARDVELDPHAVPVRKRTGPDGVYFTTNRLDAYNYTRAPGSKAPRGQIVAAHLALKNPLDITKAVAKGQKQGLSFGDAKREALKALTPEHDGVIFKGDRANSDEYIAFVSSQIRRATLKSLEALRTLEDLRTLRPQEDGKPHSTRKPFELAFNVSDPRAVDWAQDHAGDLAKNISDVTRERINDAIADWEDGDSDRGEATDAIAEAVGDDERADLIARTESMRAANEGQRQGWEQAVDDGMLPPDMRRTWIATADEVVCPICADLDGTTSELEGNYPDPGGGGPPAHPRCRCTEGIVAGE